MTLDPYNWPNLRKDELQPFGHLQPVSHLTSLLVAILGGALLFWRAPRTSVRTSSAFAHLSSGQSCWKHGCTVTHSYAIWVLAELSWRSSSAGPLDRQRRRIGNILSERKRSVLGHLDDNCHTGCLDCTSRLWVRRCPSGIPVDILHYCLS